MVLFDSENGLGALFIGQVACFDGAIWEEYSNDDTEDDGDDAGND
jgi:hypothetical protein